MDSFPIQHGTQSPSIRLSDFHEGSGRAVLIVPNSHAPDGQHVRRPRARLELAGGGKMQALRVGFAPRNETLLKVDPLSRGTSAIKNSEAALRTEACPSRVRRLETERFPTGLAWLFHSGIVAPLWIELSKRYFLDGAAYCHAAAQQVAMPDLFASLATESA